MSTGRILYITSRFPKLTETFVINEWLALAPRFDMSLAALVHTHEELVHPQAAAALDRVWFVRPVDLRTIGANLRALIRSPRTYGSTLMQVVRACARRPVDLARSLVVFLEAVVLADRVRGEGIDHVHAHFANHPATAAWIVHRFTGVPYSFTAHANDLFRSPALVRRKVDDAAFVVTISDFNARLLREMHPVAPVHVVHCGVDTAALAGTARPTPGRQLVSVASLQVKKGHRYLLDAVANLAADDPELRLTLVGDGPQRAALEARIQALGLSDRVELTGPLTVAGVRRELARADVFVLASVTDDTGRSEGIPVALMEAMAAGVPVVTTRVSGIPELVDGVGRIVEPGDPDALAQAIASVLDDPASAEVARRARALVAEQFDLYVEAAMLGDLFESSVDRSGRG